MYAVQSLKKKLKPLLLTIVAICWAACTTCHLQAQSEEPGSASRLLWPAIEKRLSQSKADTSYAFIFEMVRRQCGNDFDCLYATYHGIMIKLERHFNLLAAIQVGEEMVKMAQRNKKPEEEADASRNLNRYYGALGNRRSAAIYLDRALVLYEQLGDRASVTRARMTRLEQSLDRRIIEDVLPEMNALLEQCNAAGDTASSFFLHLRMVEHALNAHRYDEAEKHLEVLEKKQLSDPLRPEEYGIAITAALGRADLAVARNELDLAEQFYQKTLRLAEAEPSRWLEIHALISLARLEWGRKRTGLANTYLDKALAKAEALELHDLLAQAYGLKAKIAEVAGNYAEAYAFFRKERYHDEKFKSKSAGFDIENYFLQSEKEQLEAARKNDQLELGLKRTQLRSSLILVAVTLLLAILLVIAIFNLRKRKNELAAQNALIQQQAENLQALDDAKSRFFANVSHELRTPLTLMLGPINTLKGEASLDDRQRQLLKIASRNGRQLNRLINEILDLRKLEMGKMKLNLEPTDLAAFFNICTAQFDSLAQRKQIDFSFETNIADGVAAEIDREKCRQLLYNLLSNAFKFTPAGGQVKLTLDIGNIACYPISQFPDFPISISVSDTGPGIHPDDLPHVFDRFFQTNRPDKPTEGGTGIGLALCQEYVKLFGGTIEVESQLGKGSTFRAAFPVQVVPNENGPYAHENLIGQLDSDFTAAKEEIDHSATIKAACPAPIDPEKATILVVEDNPELQGFIRLILQDNYNVVMSGNGQAALDYLLPSRSESGTRPANCQLILSDLMMPVMDGYQLLERLKSDDATRHIPFIMLTARAEARDKLKALRLGVDDYLIKPFDEAELFARIENLLKNYRARQKMAAEQAGQSPPTQPVEPLPGEQAAMRPHLPPGQPLLSAPDSEWLARLEENLQRELSDPHFNLEHLARLMLVSRRHLGRQLKALTGLPPSEYLLEARLQAARQLMEDRQFKTVKEVAFAVGLLEAKHFSRQFKKRFGKSPSNWLRNP